MLTAVETKKSMQKESLLAKVVNVYTFFGVFFLIIGILLVLVPVYPQIWYAVFPDSSQKEVENILNSDEAVQKEAKEIEQKREEIVKHPLTPSNDVNLWGIKLPKLDLTLPKENKLLIPKIGVNGAIFEDADGNEGLKKGVWRTYGWGTPEDPWPIILASHRFGYVKWTKEYRDKNSFYYLPKLNVGDRFEIIWNQRKYEYEIVRAFKGENFDGFDADLILYTCEMFNSPIRIFRYAKRVN